MARSERFAERDDSTDFLLQAADTPLLTAVDEQRLARCMRSRKNSKARRAAARDRMISANIRLVIREAYGFRGRGLGLGDLQQAGIQGLIRAIDKFDPARGLRLSTYATYWIRQAIRDDLLSGGSTIRLPAHTVQSYGKFRRAQEELSADGETPGFDDVADRVGLSESARARVRSACVARRIVPTGGYGDDDSPSVEEIPASATADPDESSGVVTAEAAQQVRALLARLPLPHRVALCVRNGLCGLPQLSTADAQRLVGMAPDAVRRLEDEARQLLARPVS